FFFSSRRRHTRFSRDWSSDVCSSDLLSQHQDRERGTENEQGAKDELHGSQRRILGWAGAARMHSLAPHREHLRAGQPRQGVERKIGRASCRESVEIKRVNNAIYMIIL